MVPNPITHLTSGLRTGGVVLKKPRRVAYPRGRRARLTVKCEEVKRGK